MKKIMLLCAAMIALAAMNSCRNKKVSAYNGIWGHYNKAEITLFDDSTAGIAIWSADFVGHFRDKMSGVYSITNDSVLILQWDKTGKLNKVYCNPPYIDTLVIRNDTLYNHSEKGYFMLTLQK